MDRKTYLLKQVIKLLEKQNESRYVLNMLEEIIFYDDAEYDGACLLQDIKDELLMSGEYEEEKEENHIGVITFRLNRNKFKQ